MKLAINTKCPTSNLVVNYVKPLSPHNYSHSSRPYKEKPTIGFINQLVI